LGRAGSSQWSRGRAGVANALLTHMGAKVRR
jgi:hypothetical protein